MKLTVDTTSANFDAKVELELKEEHVAKLLGIGLTYQTELKGYSPAFKGVKERKKVQFNADTAAAVKASIEKGLAELAVDGLVVVTVTKHQWSAGAGGLKEKAQAAYDQGIKLGIGPDIALAMAKAVFADFVPATGDEAKEITTLGKASTPTVTTAAGETVEDKPEQLG